MGWGKVGESGRDPRVDNPAGNKPGQVGSVFALWRACVSGVGGSGSGSEVPGERGATTHCAVCGATREYTLTVGGATMKAQSAKAKGRKLQQFVRDTLKRIDPASSYYSRAMGSQGSDVYGGKLVGDVYVECRNVANYESLNAIVAEMRKASRGWWYITKRPKQPPIVVLPWEEFEKLLVQRERNTVER
jgi:hypothetical protein